MKIEIEVIDKGFSYKGWKITVFGSEASKEDQTDVVWFGAEKEVGDTWYWIKRTSLLDVILEVDKKEKL